MAEVELRWELRVKVKVRGFTYREPPVTSTFLPFKLYGIFQIFSTSITLTDRCKKCERNLKEVKTEKGQQVIINENEGYPTLIIPKGGVAGWGADALRLDRLTARAMVRC